MGEVKIRSRLGISHELPYIKVTTRPQPNLAMFPKRQIQQHCPILFILFVPQNQHAYNGRPQINIDNSQIYDMKMYPPVAPFTNMV